MAQFNENIKIVAPNPIDDRYLSLRISAGSQLPYSGTSEVTGATGIPLAQRYTGLTVLIQTGSTSPVEYWFRNGVEDTDLIEKKFASEQLVGDFITGATNLGYFSGQTGIQILDLSGTGFGSNDGDYFSEYNWYYADAGGTIRIGAPTHDGPLRRAYVNAARTKSWIWNVPTSQWEISLNDVIANVGNSTIIDTHSGYTFTDTTWSGSVGNATASTTASGSLTTGNTLTIGSPIYSFKANQDLNIRTIISDSSEIIKITNDDNYIRFSGSSENLSLTASNGLTKTGANITLGGTLTGTTIITDGRVASGQTGIQYDADYSASFTDRSLIDKGYLNTISSLGGERIYKTICQPSHGFSVGQVVGWSGCSYNKPIATGAYDGEVLGVVSDCFNINCFEVTQAGYISGITVGGGLITNCTYFLSSTNAGCLTTCEPTTPNYLSKSMLIATSTCSGWVLPYAGYVVTSGITQGGALIRNVCNVSASPHVVTCNDYYIGAQGADIIQLSSNVNGQVIVVDDVCGNAAVGCEVQITGVFFGGSGTACIDTPYGSMTFIYNGAKAKWSSIGFSTAPY